MHFHRKNNRKKIGRQLTQRIVILAVMVFSPSLFAEPPEAFSERIQFPAFLEKIYYWY